ncbi:Nuclear pore protein [Pleurostoma richardsiae]|uniref:Nuclear pore protein n=1 Tax=Pleurostoma richardsiae TaxID=41990 RepID=A0AA38RT82_9PEZI|nr:Nuclear pore protein [Pleurostoma richardsiae]
MSLFGKPAGGGSLFGASTGTPAPANTGGGLFASLNTNQPAASSQQAQPSTSLFGSTAAQQQQAKPSLFGSSTANTTAASQPAQASSQFGGLGASQAQPATTRPSLFGTGAAAAAPAQTSTLGATTSGNAPLGNSLFSTTNPAASSTNGPSQPQPTGAYFDSLLAKSKKQAEGEEPLEDLPSLQLGLGDLRQRLRKLGPRAQDKPLDGKAHYLLAASGVDPGAAVKDLGSFGFQSGRLDGRPAQGFAPGELDVETYLSNLQTKTTLDMIADGLERSVRDFDAFLEDNVTMEWEAQRKRIYQHFGIKPREETIGSTTATPGRESQGGGFGRSRRKTQAGAPGQRSTQRASAFGRSNMQKSVIGTPSKIGAHPSEFSDVNGATDTMGTLNGVASIDDRYLRDKQGKLADKVHSLNDSRQQNEPYPVLYEFADIESKSGDRHAHYIVEAYRAAMEIVGEDPEADPRVPGSTAKERQYARMYLDPNSSSQGAVAVRKRIIQGASRYLEKQFFSQIEAAIAKNPLDASLGGRPDVVSKIKAYIRLLAKTKNLGSNNVELQQVQGEYVWAVVYFLLRSGHVNEAAQYVNDNQNHFRSIDRTFSGYMNSYASSEDRRLKRQLQDRCASEYNQRVRNAPEGSIDPYRMACYKIIGRCELNNRSLDDALAPDVYDFLWLQFNLAREGDRSVEIAGESFGLSELQASFREIGLKHFPKSSAEGSDGNFGLFFFMQVLSGMFEQAVAYLYSFSYVDAVHFAIALEYYGLLRAADALTAGNELLSYNTRGLPQINFGRMLGYYTRDFRAANAAAAVDYIILICLNRDDPNSATDRQHAALCHEALRELVLETREFSKLIGDIKPDGHRIQGIIESRGSLIALQDEQDFIKAITLQAASYADDNGRTTDAVLLYHLAEDYDTVVAIVSRSLSEAIALEIGEDPMRLLPVKPRIDGSQAQAQPGSSLSFASIDDPVELARTMMGMYEKDRFFREKIRDPNRIACSVLLQMSEIKGLVEAGKWPQCLDNIRALEILPLNAKGDPSIIRGYASRFSSLPQPVAINVPNLLMWTIICCTKQRERLLTGQFTGNQSTARLLADELKQMSVDLTTYTSQLRYRFPPHLHEALARASAD